MVCSPVSAPMESFLLPVCFNSETMFACFQQKGAVNQVLVKTFAGHMGINPNYIKDLMNGNVKSILYWIHDIVARTDPQTMVYIQ